MPIYHTFAQRLINIITRFETMPCSPGNLAYIEAAAAALIKLWWSIHSPDIREIYHKASGESALCSVKGFLNNVKPIDDGSKIIARKGLYSLAELVDLETWWAFLTGSTLSAANLFVTDLIKGSSQCNRPHGRGWGYGDIAVGGWPGHVSSNEWFPGPTWRTTGWPEIPQCGPTMLVPAGATAVIAGSAQVVTSFGSTPVPFNQRVVWRGHESTPVTKSDTEGGVLEGFKTTSYTKVRNPDNDDHWLDLQVSFPLSIPSISAVTLPWGYGYKDWFYV